MAYRKYLKLQSIVAAISFLLAAIALNYISDDPRASTNVCSSKFVRCFAQGETNSIALWTFVISAGTFFVTMIGAISTALLSWRKDRREERESALRSQILEKEIEELQSDKIAKGH